MKTFEVKLYDSSGTFKKQINPTNITSQVSFTEELNGGQGNLNMDIVGDMDDFVCSDIIEIREVDTDNRAISATYTGVIEEIGVKEYKTTEVLNLSILGIFSLLNDIEAKSAGNRTFTKNKTPGNIVKDIIDSFNTDYGALTGDTQNLTTNAIRYTGSSIDVTGTVTNRNFEKVSCLAAIKAALENTGFDFYIGSDGICYVTQTANQTIKYLTFDREIISIDRKIHKRDMVNTYYLSRTGGTELTYTDAGSIATFNLKEKTETDSDIVDATTQNLVGNKKITDFAYERNEISIDIKPQQTSSIIPGQLITTQNTKRQIIEKQITKINKTTKSWTIYIGDFLSFGKSITGG